MKKKSGGIRPSRSQIEEGDQAAAALAAVVAAALVVVVALAVVVGEGGIVMIGQGVGIEIVDETEMKIEGTEEREVDRLIEAVIAGEIDGSEAGVDHLIGAEIEKIEIEMIVGGPAPAVGALAIAQIVGGLVGLRVVVAAAVVVGGAGVEIEVEIETETETEDLVDRRERERRDGGLFVDVLIIDSLYLYNYICIIFNAFSINCTFCLTIND